MTSLVKFMIRFNAGELKQKMDRKEKLEKNKDSAMRELNEMQLCGVLCF